MPLGVMKGFGLLVHLLIVDPVQDLKNTSELDPVQDLKNTSLIA